MENRAGVNSLLFYIYGIEYGSVVYLLGIFRDMKLICIKKTVGFVFFIDVL